MNDADNSRLPQIAYSDVATNAGLLPTVSPMVKRLTQNAADELTGIHTKANPGVQN